MIKLSAFVLVFVAMLMANTPAPMAADSEGQPSQDEFQQAKQKIDELERQLKQRIGELVLQLRAKDNEIAALRSSAHEDSKQLRQDLAARIEEINQAKRRIAELEQQLATTGKGQELIQAKRRAAEAEQQTARKDQELAQAKGRIAEVEQQLAVKAKEQEPSQPKRRVAEAEQELAQAKRRVIEVEEQLAGKEQELAQAKRRAAEVEQQLAGKDQESTQAKRRTAEAEQQLTGKEQELALAKRRIAETDQQIAGKEQELAQVKRRVSEADQQTAGKDQELVQAKRRTAEVEQQLAGKEQEWAQAKRRAAEAEQQTARKEQELAQVKEDLKQVTQKLADLTPQLTAKDAELARTKQLLTELELNSSKPAGSAPAQEESPSSLSLQSIDHNLSLANQLGPDAEIMDDGEPLTFNADLAKISDSLSNLLQPELKKGSATLRQRGNKLTLTLAAGELFPAGDATVTLGGTSLLERVGVVLHGFRYQSIEVAGHTDNTPLRNDHRRSFRDNLDLSRARAEHAIQVLVNGGLEADRAKAVGHVDTRPIATNDTEKDRSKNRRMEIVITQWQESANNLSDGKPQVGKKPQESPPKR
ncbi:MAG TPA: OmpA family protein [Nitrospira sp.]|nr:OmpA family protein [Nitrospira sp.]